MRRLCAFATFVSLAFALPLFAQHGGGHASSGGGHGGGGGFGGHGSFSGSHSTISAPRSNHTSSGIGSRSGYGAHSASGARSYAGSRAYAPAFRPPQHNYSANQSADRAASANRFSYANRIDGGRFRIRNRGFAGPWRYGYPGWYGYYYPYFYDPYWFWDSSSSYSDDQNQDQDVAQASVMNEQGPEDQGARDGYADDYNDRGDQDAYARSAERPWENEPRHSELTAPSPPTTLVFRDQHKEEIQNYAIVGNTLFSFSAERTQKIPLSDLDIPATTKVNGDRGVNFKVPDESR